MNSSDRARAETKDHMIDGKPVRPPVMSSVFKIVLRTNPNGGPCVCHSCLDSELEASANPEDFLLKLAEKDIVEIVTFPLPQSPMPIDVFLADCDLYLRELLSAWNDKVEGRVGSKQLSALHKVRELLVRAADILETTMNTRKILQPPDHEKALSGLGDLLSSMLAMRPGRLSRDEPNPGSNTSGLDPYPVSEASPED